MISAFNLNSDIKKSRGRFLEDGIVETTVQGGTDGASLLGRGNFGRNKESRKWMAMGLSFPRLVNGLFFFFILQTLRNHSNKMNTCALFCVLTTSAHHSKPTFYLWRKITWWIPGLPDSKSHVFRWVIVPGRGGAGRTGRRTNRQQRARATLLARERAVDSEQMCRESREKHNFELHSTF